MPLNMADFDTTYYIQRISGDEKHRHHLEALGFTEESPIRIISEFAGYYLVLLRGSKIGLDKAMAKKIILRG